MNEILNRINNENIEDDDHIQRINYKKILLEPFSFVFNSSIDKDFIGDNSKDCFFNIINIDLETLTKIKNLNFWQGIVQKVNFYKRDLKKLNIDELFSFYDVFEESILIDNVKYTAIVNKIYKSLFKLVSKNGDKNWRNDKIKNISLKLFESDKSITDEFYLTLIKLSRNNPKDELKIKIWNLINLFSAIHLPSEDITYLLMSYLIMVIDHLPNTQIKMHAQRTLKQLF